MERLEELRLSLPYYPEELLQQQMRESLSYGSPTCSVSLHMDLRFWRRCNTLYNDKKAFLSVVQKIQYFLEQQESLGMTREELLSEIWKMSYFWGLPIGFSDKMVEILETEDKYLNSYQQKKIREYENAVKNMRKKNFSLSDMKSQLNKIKNGL